MKKIIGIYNPPRQHWVGDGFPVHSLFSYGNKGELLSPFLLLDYAAPTRFEPTTHRRGVGEHPHRGFETVTIVYDGEVEHRDSSGGGGVIKEGDVQWMTAGGGILHQEFHSEDYAKRGGAFEMVQLWVNLPSKDKMTPARYQSITNDVIPVVSLPNEAGQVRVIAGEYEQQQGAAKTFSPVNVWDIRLNANKMLNLTVPEGYSFVIVVLRGDLNINGEQQAHDKQLVVLSQQGQQVVIQAERDSKLLVLSGQPLNEPIVGYGPFVMNTQAEINQAILDFNRGKFGSLAIH